MEAQRAIDISAASSSPPLDGDDRLCRCDSAYIDYIKSCHAIIMREFFIYRGTTSVLQLQLSGRAAPCSALRMQPLATDERWARSEQPYHSTRTASVIPGLYEILAWVATVKMWI